MGEVEDDEKEQKKLIIAARREEARKQRELEALAKRMATGFDAYTSERDKLGRII